jgi:SAM-dependent methyltransferase
MTQPEPMYSGEWFETFAATVPASITAADLDGITAALPLDAFPRLLDVGCGIGRIAGPLSGRGYTVTGIDVSLDALHTAKRRAAGPRYLALDQRHVGHMRWVFDGALLLWNSLGFVGRDADLSMVAGLAQVLRPGGKLVFDLYHPGWLSQNERAGHPDDRGAVVRRWMRGGRCFHEIRYGNGRVDDIQFDVYQPEEIRELSRRAGLVPAADMVWWKTESRPSPSMPRYQLVCTRPA